MSFFKVLINLFDNLENLFYEKFDKYKETENNFLCNGGAINKSQTLEENNIKDGSIIVMIDPD